MGCCKDFRVYSEYGWRPLKGFEESHSQSLAVNRDNGARANIDPS